MALTDESGLVMPVSPMYGQGGGFGGGDWSWIIVLFLFALMGGGWNNGFGGGFGGDDGHTGSELSRVIQEKGLANVLPALDELLDAVQVYNPKLYKSFLRKL